MQANGFPRAVLVLLSASTLFTLGCPRVQPPDMPPNLAVAEQLREAIGGGSSAASATPDAAQTANPTGWASIKGTIRVSEKVGFEPIAVDKDVDVCGMKAPNESVVCGPNNELKNVLVYLSTKIPTDQEPWVHGSYAEKSKGTVEFDQKNCIFLSHVFAMQTTQNLKILNSDSIGHNTSIAAFGYNRIIPAKAADDSAEAKATEPSDVSCSIHPWMKAYIYAGKNPYYAITNDKGEFEIAQVPAGVELEFRFWQEKIKFIPEATVNGSLAKLPKGKMKIALANDEQKSLEIVLDAGKFK